MCTASWLIRPDGYELFFNRDERSERSRASEPRTIEVGGMGAIAPRDADAGGTWIGVNELGLTVGLLNSWADAEPTEGAFRSRGLLVRDLLDSSSQRDVETRLEALDLSIYMGFYLVAFAPAQEPRGHRWDGRELFHGPATAPVSSSSFDREGVATERSAQWQALRERHGELDVELLELFHHSHYPERGPLSVCMHRDDAATVSATHISVSDDVVRVRYAAGAPCCAPYGAPVVLERLPEFADESSAELAEGESAYP